MTAAPDDAVFAIGRRLIEAGLAISCAESLTGGLLAAELCRVPGISAVFQGGVVAYQTPLKHLLIGVDEQLLAREGAVHPEVARQLARGARERVTALGEPAAIGLGTTGVAGPDPQDGRAAGTVFVGVSSRLGDRAAQLRLVGLIEAADPIASRERIRRATVAAALAELARELDALGAPADEGR
ncbi:Protein MG115 [Pseudoclavibacter triregionum]|nr:Protein MG115 [Pseudoclavibacter triregionum]